MIVFFKENWLTIVSIIVSFATGWVGSKLHTKKVKQKVKLSKSNDNTITLQG